MTEAPQARELSHHAVDHAWHVAINEHTRGADWSKRRFMYDAKHAAYEVPRLTLLFARERRGELSAVHVQCAHCHPEPEPVPDNHLTCCLGVVCRDCPHLQALDKAQVTDEQRDAIKAWTCVTHIVANGGDVANEGFILTTDDALYRKNLYASLARGTP